MQIILTEEEYAALKEKRVGVDPGAVQAAKQELVRKLSSAFNSSYRSQQDLVKDIHSALCKFDNEISAAITAAN